jgi:hypothetical protein
VSTWSKNNLAHRRTFLTLRILDQTNREFDQAADQKMSELKFSVTGDSQDMRSEKARSLASVINNVFVDAFKTDFESGFDNVQSVDGMAAVLADPTKTVLELADTADGFYKFFGEEP